MSLNVLSLIRIENGGIRYCRRMLFSLAVDANYGTLLLLPGYYSCRYRFAL
jgi:hypothetical protein